MSKSGPINTTQDWETVVFKKKVPTGPKATDEKLVSQARQAGGEIETLKKFNAGGNKATPGTVVNAAKLDAETESFELPKVPKGLSDAIRDGRMAKKWKQKQFAQAINELASLITDYENGKAIPNGQLIAKIERALGVKLPRPPKK
eukprot:EC122020.1.p1 GENE.EC122020.1~~EC122020.1.p1  ORF type:complete len:146 (+),score=26.80 EC122020.1:133-570(+)